VTAVRTPTQTKQDPTTVPPESVDWKQSPNFKQTHLQQNLKTGKRNGQKKNQKRSRSWSSMRKKDSSRAARGVLRWTGESRIVNNPGGPGEWEYGKWKGCGFASPHQPVQIARKALFTHPVHADTSVTGYIWARVSFPALPFPSTSFWASSTLRQAPHPLNSTFWIYKFLVTAHLVALSAFIFSYVRKWDHCSYPFSVIELRTENILF
jgi:hypothetical protein